MRVFSHSQLESFRNCRKRFWYRYIERVKSTKAQGVEGFMGTRVHAVIERTFHHIALHNEVPPISALGLVFDREWLAEMPASGLHVARRGMTLNDYRLTGHRALSHFWGKIHDGTIGPRPVGVERPLDFTVGGRAFTGVIDYLGRLPGGRVEVRDFKAGKPKTLRECEADPQLALYEIGLRQTYADEGTDYLLVHEFLAVGSTVVHQRTEEQLAAVEAEVVKTCEAIETEKRWAATPSPLCGWCDYSNVCPESRAR